MTFRAFFSGCWFGCERQHTRDAQGRLILQCQDCGSVTRVLESAVIKGPAHDQVETLGVPTGRAIRESKLTRIRRA